MSLSSSRALQNFRLNKVHLFLVLMQTPAVKGLSFRDYSSKIAAQSVVKLWPMFQAPSSPVLSKFIPEADFNIFTSWSCSHRSRVFRVLLGCFFFFFKLSGKIIIFEILQVVQFNPSVNHISSYS